MCGIAGYVTFDGQEASAIRCKNMTDSIAHRGPDGEGQWAEAMCALGHRRLSIVDLSDRSSQPMHSSNGRYILTYNGELYNFKTLRQDLINRGYIFRSEGDAEVFLESLVEWGIERALNRFNGMFAFALWDRETRRLVVGRDRYGIKPVYYSSGNNGFAFGSEIKALIAGGFCRAKLDAEGLVEYLTFQNFLTSRTLHEDAKTLPAGCYLEIKPGMRSPHITQYWDYQFDEPETRRSPADYEEELDFLFRQAVSRQLMSDVPIGAYLSGGMDSGAIAALSAEQLPHLQSFTVGFDSHSISGLEIGIDERPTAEFMSYKFHTEHYEMVLKAGDMARIMKPLTWHLEEPRVGQCYPNFFAAKLASKFVKVVMSGAGGDEMFGGYPWRYYRAANSLNFDSYVLKYYDFWQRLLNHDSKMSVMAPIWESVSHVDTKALFCDVLRGMPGSCKRPEDYVNRSLYFEAKTFLHGLLIVEDKLSMAHGLESRVPFLDNDLVDFAMKLPASAKLGNLQQVVREDENQTGKAQVHFRKTNDGKLILRNLMRRYIPHDITEAVKQGFSAPDATWFKGESIEYIKTVLFDGTPAVAAYLEHDAMRALVEEHFAGHTNRRLLIWSLLYLETWCQLFLEPKMHEPEELA